MIQAPAVVGDPVPPYGIIADQLSGGHVVPFLGSGASLGSRKPGDEFDGNRPMVFPRSDELAEWLAEKSQFPERPAADLAKVASYFQVRGERDLLREYLARIFRSQCAGSAIHDLLADIRTPMLIVTTNYDTLVERAFQARGRPYHLVTYPDPENPENAASVLWWKPNATDPIAYQPSQLPLSVETETIIFKMHGTVLDTKGREEWEGFVITEEDYVRFLARMAGKGGGIPSRFMLHLRNSSLLFLGYGLRDWNLRVMLEKLRRPIADRREKRAAGVRRPGEKPAWAIQRNPSVLEEILWQHRNVQIFNQDLTTFAAAIRASLRL